MSGVCVYIRVRISDVVSARYFGYVSLSPRNASVIRKGETESLMCELVQSKKASGFGTVHV